MFKTDHFDVLTSFIDMVTNRNFFNFENFIYLSNQEKQEYYILLSSINP